MHELANQKLSQYVDNELSGKETLELLQQLKEQPDLNGKISRYQMVSQVLKNETPVLVNTDFVEQVNQSLEQDVTYLLPKRRRSIGTVVSGLALVASFAIVTVIINKQTDKSENNRAIIQVADNQQSAESQLQPTNPRFNEYLHAHRGSLYIAEPAAHPYAKLAGYGK